ncbi:hypothetical protein [Pseudomarimonas arenosa]|uniref:ATPase n=1 Tax=Pseudomarimonas arenosa TaxID=2774145 RepID=A0AAW3ZIA7_9GAMM|nr:hypothetical protein [Pseudomarimonas arenosa]MBD8524444.1 hypothetical protein [Pseudomarimonas arenosa]
MHDVAFGLTIVEMSESVRARYVDGRYVRDTVLTSPRSSRARFDDWTTMRDFPSGRLRLAVYAPHYDVAWTTTFDETKTRSLTTDIRRIIRSLEDATPVVLKKIDEAAERRERWRQERLIEAERQRREADQRAEAQSIKDSHAQLEQVIQAWAKATSLEQFFRGVEQRASDLPAAERETVDERLRLARDFIGTQDPLAFFLEWKTPRERYVPLAARGSTEDWSNE